MYEYGNKGGLRYDFVKITENDRNERICLSGRGEEENEREKEEIFKFVFYSYFGIGNDNGSFCSISVIVKDCLYENISD